MISNLHYCVGSALQGRESEWLFAHPEGQWAVARDCLAKRVILVVLNRGHEFTASKNVQAELSPLVCSPCTCLLLHEICCLGVMTRAKLL